MSELVEIDGRDKYRVMLSEILPHEVLPRFSTRHLYARFRSATTNPLDEVICAQRDPSMQSIPYAYSIARGRRSQRKIHVVHPCHYRTIVDFLNKYDQQIIANCRKSRWSLRAPAAVARRFRERTPLGAGSEEQRATIENPARFFVYKPFNLSYRFFDSDAFTSLESRFRHYRALDVKACFDSIYTHSVSWAIRSKPYAKRLESKGSKYSFDGEFDALMQRMNHLETHGIVIGPEFSRVFAELLFQAIDAEVLATMPCDYVEGVHFEVRRYLDDYYIFYNQHVVADTLENRLVEVMQGYKLHLNEAKTVDYTSPFMSRISGVKSQISAALDGFHERLKERVSRGKPARRGTGRQLLVEFKRLVADSGCDYEVCAQYCLSIIQNKIQRVSGEIARCYLDSGILYFACRVLELDFRYQTAIRFSILGQLIREKLAMCSTQADAVREFDAAVADQILLLVENALGREIPPVLSLLVCLIPLKPNQLVFDTHPGLLERLWDVALGGDKSTDVDYFTVVALLYLAEADSSGDVLVRKITNAVESFMASLPENCLRADASMLAADLACCPFISNSVRRSMIGHAYRFIGRKKNVNRTEVMAAIVGQYAFFDWDSGRDTLAYLLDKQNTVGYA